jgi:uncharacterized membrane protein YgaE (UPF0421/DUF939 family)
MLRPPIHIDTSQTREISERFPQLNTEQNAVMPIKSTLQCTLADSLMRQNDSNKKEISSVQTEKIHVFEACLLFDQLRPERLYVPNPKDMQQENKFGKTPKCRHANSDN